MRRVALPCGIAGGVWGLLAPVLVLLPVTVQATPSVTGGVVEEEMVSMVEAGVAGDALPILSFIALMGVLGLLAIVLSRRRPRRGKPFLWTSAIAMLAVSLLGIFSIGLFFLPASALLLVAAIGLKGESERGEASKYSIGSLRGTKYL
jgi:4-amino-4-deoxy-L-arabinose transferase-like glycosyltransferase